MNKHPDIQWLRMGSCLGLRLEHGFGKAERILSLDHLKGITVYR